MQCTMGNWMVHKQQIKNLSVQLLTLFTFNGCNIGYIAKGHLFKLKTEAVVTTVNMTTLCKFKLYMIFYTKHHYTIIGYKPSVLLGCNDLVLQIIT